MQSYLTLKSCFAMAACLSIETALSLFTFRDLRQFDQIQQELCITKVNRQISKLFPDKERLSE